MNPSPHLDDFTLLVCGNGLLLAMALTLATVNSGQGDAARALRIWVGSLLVLVLSGAALLSARWLTLPAWLPPPTVLAAGWLVCATVLQQLAVQQVCRGRLGWRTVGLYGGLALLLGTAAAWLLPGPNDPALLSASVRIIAPVFAVLRLAPCAKASRGARVMLAGVALGILGAIVALLRLLGHEASSPVFPISVDIITTFIGTLGLLLWYQERIESRLSRTAMTDPLTGVLNRHGLMQRLDHELARATRTGRPISLVLCDLDHFKNVNDHHGHATGDAVLQRFAERTSRLIRRHDVFGRWGGEEFLLILPDTPLDRAIRAAERMRASQARPAEGLPVVTLSAGVVSAPRDGWGYCTSAELLASADRLMDVAKETRNRVVSVASLDRDIETPAVADATPLHAM